jgi:L-fucose isomerase-like protein
VATVKDSELRQAVRTYLAIRSILEEEQALGFGVNCYGDLIINDGRDTPCLAQTLLREDGYIAACDGDYLAMMNMVLTSYFLDKPCMMSNMYPVEYEAALRDHFGDPLSPDESRYPRESWPNLARLGHCAFVGVVSPEMDPSGVVPLHDFGGTYEIHRDGRGCGNAGDLAAGAPMTVTELKFDARTLLIARGEVCETTYHEGMPHCEKTALLRFDNLRAFVDRISREHTVVVYGEHVEDYRTLAGVLGLEAEVF